MDWQKFSSTLATAAVSIVAWTGVGSMLGPSMSTGVKIAIQAVATIATLFVFNYIALMINPSFFCAGGQVAVPPTPPTQQDIPPPAGAATAEAGAAVKTTTSGGTTSANLSLVPNAGMSGASSHH